MLVKYRAWFLIILIAIMAVNGIRVSVSSFAPDRIYGKDFVTIYLSTRCALTGDDLSRTLRSLAKDHLNVSLPADWRDDHGVLPPPVGVIFVPIGLLDFKTAAVFWWVLDLFWLLFAVFLVFRNTGLQLPRPKMFLVVLFLLGLAPVFLSLYVGQVVVLILFLLAASRQAAKCERNWLAGALLGTTLLLKFVTWPILLAPVITRNWRAVMSAILVICLGYGMAAFVFGAPAVLYYFETVLPSQGAELLMDPSNLSITALIHRIFVGTNTWGDTALSAPPLISMPELARPLSAGVQLTVIAVACWLLRERRNFSEWVGVLICIALLIGPVTRDHYMILAIIPATEIFYGLRGKYRSLEFWLFLSAVFTLCIPHYRWIHIVRILAGLPRKPTAPFELPFWPAIITVLLPVLALLWMTVLSYRYSNSRQNLST